MVFSAVVLFLQLSVVQADSASRIDSNVALVDAVTPAAQVSNGLGSSVSLADAEPTMALLVPPPTETALNVPLEPGRVTPIPIVAAGAGPLAELPLESSSKPAAFVASPGLTDNRARWEEQRRKRFWLALGIAQSSTATFDAWTTRRVISSGEGHEMDPLLRPFAGNASLYAAIQVGPLALEYLGWRMMHSEHPWERRIWWMPQSLGAAMNFASGVHNLGVH